MKTDLPKVLFPVAGWPMVKHVIAACQELAPERIVVVVSPTNRLQVAEVVAPHECVVQKEQLGTGDALKAAHEKLEDFEGDILLLYGDVPLVNAESLQEMRRVRAETGAAIVVGGFTPDDPAAYGRLILDGKGRLTAIVETKDADKKQLEIKFCNSGIILFDSKHLWTLLGKLRDDNAKKEFYVTDCIKHAQEAKLACAAVEIPFENAAGVNTRVELAGVEKMMQKRLREKAMLNGVTMTDPDTVYLCADTKLGRDVTIGPNVVFETGVEVADRVVIRAFCHLEKVRIASGALIGPFARLRPGAQIGENVHIGNFVEIKNAEVSAGAKVNHLTYIGDAFIGEKTNIGAGTITCNYDGYNKFRTHIGAGVNIGSNTSLVAPVRVEDKVITGAGSVITKDVPEGALAVSRSQQMNIDGWATKFRAQRQKTKQ